MQWPNYADSENGPWKSTEGKGAGKQLSQNVLALVDPQNPLKWLDEALSYSPTWSIYTILSNPQASMNITKR